MKRPQHSLMKFDPATGEPEPYPSHAQQWRNGHPETAWLFDPWSGDRRLARAVGLDPFGMLIQPPGEPVYAASNELAVAQSLARHLWEKHYKIDTPQWEPFDDLGGVLSQIDNMVAGLIRKLCPICQGKGSYSVIHPHRMTEKVPCTTCKGTGVG